jgi:hypothetical protein
MGSIYLRKYGVATTIDFCLYELDGTDLKVDAAHAAGDIAIMKDEGNQATPDNGFTDEGTGYSLILTSTEMQAARIVIYIVDQTSPKVWLDKCLIIETYGHASGQHVFDLGTATVNLSAASEAQIDAIETDTNEIQGKLPTNKIMGSSVVTDKDDEIDAIKAKTDNLPSDPADESLIEAAITAAHVTTNGKIDAVDDYVDTEVAAIKAKTDLIPASPATEGKQDTIISYIDTEVAAIKAVTDTLSLATIADTVLDEVTEGTTTLRQAIKLISSALFAKTSGGGTATLVAQDIGDTKPRITVTADADGNRIAVTLDAT